jgi:hypothetical protein
VEFLFSFEHTKRLGLHRKISLSGLRGSIGLFSLLSVCFKVIQILALINKEKSSKKENDYCY